MYPEHRIENIFKSYALIVDVENIEYQNTFRIFQPEFFLIGLNDRNEWFDVDVFCFEGQPIAKDFFTLQDPDAPLPRFLVNLDTATKFGVHRVDLLMALDLEDPQAIENVSKISYHLQDSTGVEVELRGIPVQSKHNHFVGVMLSFRLENGSWKLLTKPETYPYDISEMIMEFYAAVEGQDGSFEPSPTAKSGPRTKLVGFKKPQKPTQPSNKTTKDSSSVRSSVKTAAKSAAKALSKTIDKVTEQSKKSPETSNDKKPAQTVDDNAKKNTEPQTIEDTVVEEGLKPQVDIFGDGEIASAEHETHLLRNVDFSMVQMDSMWLSGREHFSVRHADELFKIGREHRLIDVDNVFKNPSPHPVFQVPEVVIGTVVFKSS